MIQNLKKIAFEVRNSVQEFLDIKFHEAREIIKIGADGTPTSRIDLVAEEQVFKIVKENDLPFNILSEEYGYLNRNYEDTLILDPIDGSFNAEMNIPFYSISMALGKDDLFGIKYALVMNLVSGKSYWAERGKGSYFEDRKLNARSEKKEKLTIISLGKNVPESVFNIIKNSRRVRSLGCASLEMSLVADGTADAFLYYYNKRVLRIIDIAASTLIVREAGGEVYDLDDFKPLNMPFDLSLKKNVLSTGDIEYAKQLRGFLK